MIKTASKIKKLLSVAIVGIICITPNTASFANINVKGYYRSNRTYVWPHYRTSPNRSINENWSTYGKTNPYKGKKRL